MKELGDNMKITKPKKEKLLEVVCNRCGSGDEIGSCDWLASEAGFDIWCFLCDMPTQKEYREFSDE
jgi:hypothetical protein